MCNEQRFSESGAPITPARCAEYGKLKAQNEVLLDKIARLRTILTPLLSHATSHDYAPPLKYSVAACREMLRAINGDNN